MEFEHYRSTFLGVYINLLSTDTHCLVIKLSGQCGMVDTASRGPSALADILVEL